MPEDYEVAVVRHLPYLFRIAYNILGTVADAEDAVQECACKFLGRRPKLRDPNAVGTYLARMVANHCRDSLRGRRRSIPLEEIGEAAAPDIACEPDAELGKWLSQLAPEERLALDLFYHEGRSIDEIAEISGDSPSAVKARLHRARQKLRRMAVLEGVRLVEE